MLVLLDARSRNGGNGIEFMPDSGWESKLIGNSSGTSSSLRKCFFEVFKNLIRPSMCVVTLSISHTELIIVVGHTLSPKWTFNVGSLCSTDE